MHMKKYRRKTGFFCKKHDCRNRQPVWKGPYAARTAARLFFCTVLVLTLLLPCMTAGFCDGKMTGAAEDSRQFVDPVTYPDRYSGVLYNNTNGMPTSEANAVAETSDGFIWIGSYSGLSRYDGNSFLHIPTASSACGSAPTTTALC